MLYELYDADNEVVRATQEMDEREATERNADFRTHGESWRWIKATDEDRV